jgi:hypothetical protein
MDDIWGITHYRVVDSVGRFIRLDASLHIYCLFIKETDGGGIYLSNVLLFDDIGLRYIGIAYICLG